MTSYNVLHTAFHPFSLLDLLSGTVALEVPVEASYFPDDFELIEPKTKEYPSVLRSLFLTSEPWIVDEEPKLAVDDTAAFMAEHAFQFTDEDFIFFDDVLSFQGYITDFRTLTEDETAEFEDDVEAEIDMFFGEYDEYDEEEFSPDELVDQIVSLYTF